MTIKRLSLVLPALLVSVGCEQRLESPEPKVTSVRTLGDTKPTSNACMRETAANPLPPADCNHGNLKEGPPVVCDQQLTTLLGVKGTGLTPLTIRTLGGTGGKNQPQTLELPSLTLARTGELIMGAGAGGETFRIPDDFDSPGTSCVRWQCQTSMSFEAHAGLMLKDGVYDLTLKNPDGQAVTINNALAAVPPPTITKVEPMSICVEQMDVMVTITGTGFLQIGTTLPTVTFTPLGGGTAHPYTPIQMLGCRDIATAVTQGLKQCTGMVVLIKMMDLAPGMYNVVVTNPAPANCSSTQSVVINVAPPPKVTDVTPKTICAGGGTLDVKGEDFQNGATVTLGTTGANQVVFMTSNEVQAVFGAPTANFMPGMTYDLTLTNPDGCKSTLPNAVTAISGPVLFFVDPPVVFNGITTQVTMYATSVSPPLKSVTMTLTGAAGQPIVLQAIIDPNHPKRILAQIPKGTAAGQYDITVVDNTGCPATLVKGLTVTDRATVVLTAIAPPFGWKDATTPVTITAAGGLLPTPRAYLNPHNAGAGTIATALKTVAFVSATKLTAIVPKGLDPAANPYDVIVVNPDGTVGVLIMPATALYRSTDKPPPVIDTVTPGALETNAPAPVTISGANFRMPAVLFRCITDLATGTRTDFPATVSGSSGNSITINNPPVSAVVAPSLCTIRVTNGDDMTYADFSAVALTNGSGNLAPPKAGTALPQARRAVSLVGNAATRAARFLYAIGGDNGAAGGAMDTVVTTTTDENGTGSSWFTQRYHLNTKRTMAGAASLGRFIYVAGGNDGAGPVNSAERALVLDPLQAPQVSDIDIVPGAGQGLGGGIWYYRVAALTAANDPDNPSGETLASDEFTIQLPDLPQKLKIVLTWTAVTSADGTPVAGYRIYRSPMPGMISGQEQQLADVAGGNPLTFTDDGTATPSAGTPLPQGSTGVWRVLPAMAQRRESPGVAFGTDPSDASKHYLYVTLGRSQAGALASYEYLPITVGATQTFPNMWTTGLQQSAAARYQHSIYSADHAIASFVPAGTNYIYLGGGTNNGVSAVQVLEVGRVATGGDLGALGGTGATIKSFGHGYAIAANYLYGFGDEAPSDNIRAGQIVQGGAPAVANYNNNGGKLLMPRYLPGTALHGALIYLAGGSTAGQNGATTSVEWMIW